VPGIIRRRPSLSSSQAKRGGCRVRQSQEPDRLPLECDWQIVNISLDPFRGTCRTARATGEGSRFEKLGVGELA